MIIKSRCPTFKMMGSKARIAKWLISYFPKNFDLYAEPFCGRGNVFFRLVFSKILNYKNIYLNDKYMNHFLTALMKLDNFDFIDSIANRTNFDKWKNSAPSLERDVAECYLAFNGNKYLTGCNNTINSKNRHNKISTIQRCLAAHNLLIQYNVNISNLDYKDFLNILDITSDSFIYIDPPILILKHFIRILIMMNY